VAFPWEDPDPHLFGASEINRDMHTDEPLNPPSLSHFVTNLGPPYQNDVTSLQPPPLKKAQAPFQCLVFEGVTNTHGGSRQQE